MQFFFQQIAFLGVNNHFGRTTSLLLKQCSFINRLNLYDNHDVTVGNDIFNINTRCMVRAFQGPDYLQAALKNSDIIVIGNESMGAPDEQLEEMAPNILHYTQAFANYSPNAILVIAASPINVSVPLVIKKLVELGYSDFNKVLGCTASDIMHAKVILARYLELDPKKVILPVVGGSSPETRVPIFSQAWPISKIAKDDMIKIVREIKTLDEQIYTMKNEPEVLSSAVGLVHFLKSVSDGLKGVPDVTKITLSRSDLIPGVEYFSLPVALGRSGIVDTFELSGLTDYENKMMERAIVSIKRDIEKADRILEIAHKNKDIVAAESKKVLKDMLRKISLKKPRAEDELKCEGERLLHLVSSDWPSHDNNNDYMPTRSDVVPYTNNEPTTLVHTSMASQQNKQGIPLECTQLMEKLARPIVPQGNTNGKSSRRFSRPPTSSLNSHATMGANVSPRTTSSSSEIPNAQSYTSSPTINESQPKQVSTPIPSGPTVDPPQTFQKYPKRIIPSLEKPFNNPISLGLLSDALCLSNTELPKKQSNPESAVSSGLYSSTHSITSPSSHPTYPPSTMVEPQTTPYQVSKHSPLLKGVFSHSCPPNQDIDPPQLSTAFKRIKVASPRTQSTETSSLTTTLAGSLEDINNPKSIPFQPCATTPGTNKQQICLAIHPCVDSSPQKSKAFPSKGHIAMPSHVSSEEPLPSQQTAISPQQYSSHQMKEGLSSYGTSTDVSPLIQKIGSSKSCSITQDKPEPEKSITSPPRACPPTPMTSIPQVYFQDTVTPEPSPPSSITPLLNTPQLFESNRKEPLPNPITQSSEPSTRPLLPPLVMTRPLPPTPPQRCPPPIMKSNVHFNPAPMIDIPQAKKHSLYALIDRTYVDIATFQCIDNVPMAPDLEEKSIKKYVESTVSGKCDPENTSTLSTPEFLNFKDWCEINTGENCDDDLTLAERFDNKEDVAFEKGPNSDKVLNGLSNELYEQKESVWRTPAVYLPPYKSTLDSKLSGTCSGTKLVQNRAGVPKSTTSGQSPHTPKNLSSSKVLPGHLEWGEPFVVKKFKIEEGTPFIVKSKAEE